MDKVIFTKHALDRMEERDISKTEVYDCFRNPDRSCKKDGKVLSMKLRQNAQVLIVVYEQKKSIKVVISVISSSNIRKYLGHEN